MATDKGLSTIHNLVEEYNKAEKLQHMRLIKLFGLMGERSGYRKVDFSGAGSWSNAWGAQYKDRPDLAHEAHVSPMIQEITNVVPGEEK